MFYLKSTSGFYPTKNYQNVDYTGAVEITYEQHVALLQAQSEGAQIKADAEGKPFAAFPNPPTLAELKTAKKSEITQIFNATMQQVVGGTPSYEINSWSEQKAEALAFSANALSVTPLIDSMATARGVPKATLAARIIAKAVFFAGISGQLIGKRQGLEESIDAATSKTALASIIW